MSYKFSRGTQIIGDLSGSDDANRDTGIDFEENEIKLVAGGVDVFKVSGSHAYLANGSNLYLGGNSRLFFDGDDAGIDVFAEEDGTNNLLLDGNNRIKLRADQQIIIQENGSTKFDFNFDNDDVRVYLPISSSQQIEGTTIINNGGRKANIQSVTTSPKTLTTDDHMVAVNTDSVRSIILPAVSADNIGTVFIIMDAFGSSAGAGANNNNITISAATGQYIGAASSYTIDTAGGTVSLVALDSNGWLIFNKVTS